MVKQAPKHCASTSPAPGHRFFSCGPLADVWIVLGDRFTMPLLGTLNLTHTQNPSTVGICLNGLLWSIQSYPATFLYTDGFCQIQKAVDVGGTSKCFSTCHK